MAMLTSPVRALVVLAALPVGFLMIAVPHLGLYLITGLMIAQWPDQVIKLAGAAVIGAAGLWALANRRPFLTFDSLFLVQLLLTVVVWVSALTTGLGTRVPTTIPMAYTSFLALTWAFGTLANRPRVVQRVADSMLLSGVIIAIIGLAQYQLHFVWIVSASRLAADNPLITASVTDTLMWEGSFRIESLTGTPDYLGISMQILLPFAAFWTVQAATRTRQVLGLLAIALLAAALLLSQTRGVMLTTALIVAPLLAVKFGWRRSLPYLGLGLLVGIAAVLLVPPLRNRALTLTNDLFGNSTDASDAIVWRLTVLPIAWRMFMDHFWLGAGLWQQRYLWRDYASSEVFTPGLELQLPLHNAYLLIGIDLGIVGLLLLVLLIALAWYKLRRLQHYYRGTNQMPMLRIAQATEIAWAALAVNNLMYPLLETFRYFWVLLALIGALARVAADQQSGAIQREVDHA
jgi:O-antigen ligase